MTDLERELRSVIDTTAPPSTTALDDVLRRGRRRVYALRAGAVAGVVAVVAGAGLAAFALRSTPTSMPPADGPAVTSTGTVPPPAPELWPVVDLPNQVPYGTWKPAASASPAPGREILNMPQCSVHWEDRVAVDFGTAPVSSEFLDAFVGVIGQVSGLAVPGELKTAVLQSTQNDGQVSFSSWIDVTDVGGTGSLSIAEGRYTGAPLEAADQEAFLSGNCNPPNRLVMDDGTVVQHVSAVPSEPFQSLTQQMRIYRPDGRSVEIVLRNFGSPDFRVDDAGTSFDRFGQGRQTMPLSDAQLEAIGQAVARVG
ncbi:MAG: hypothetical protein ABWY11_26780 [Umezawaea sp.]